MMILILITCRINAETNTKYSCSIMYKIGFSYNLLFQHLHLCKTVIPPLKSRQISSLIFFYFIFFLSILFCSLQNSLLCIFMSIPTKIFSESAIFDFPCFLGNIHTFFKFMNIWKDNSIETKTQQIYFCNACYSVFFIINFTFSKKIVVYVGI